ncbi:hypothetical protein F2P44_11610 [Massilia sp. CCM 8695]|uniref:Uncharacterized protein n=1 Tax=Massilia frigida TaxID=2609281 RepID=A0ABX0N4E1_9BURK|nr:hypothetical protein [Massilia frigida]NHZ79917.1 hypothetical protein [Massilia frigida]
MNPDAGSDVTLTEQVVCRQCFQTASITLGYGDVNGALRSWESFFCPHCRLTWESDDIGFLQPEPRTRMLEAHGEWTVRIGGRKVGV